jgi:pimeloyl-ACP methyl ester carboxylesterase
MITNQVLDVAREFLRPAGWRGKTPDPGALEGSLIFPRDRRVTSFDGTDIAYSVHGRKGPWVVLVPGFVCPDNFWKYLLPELSRDHRIVVYDLRGLGLSGTPHEPGHRATGLSPEDFSIPSQVSDLEAVLDAEGIESATLIGHSMGGQILMEAYRLIPQRISSLVMLTAPFESPIRTFYGRDFSTVFHVTRRVFSVLPRSSVLVWRLLFLVNPTLTHELAKLTRALGPRAKLEDMGTYYRHMAYLDPLVILMMAESMRSHSAADVLRQVRVPTLIIAGSKDTFTPPAVAQLMHAEIPDSELVMIADASHGAVIESPDEINRAIRHFLASH